MKKIIILSLLVIIAILFAAEIRRGSLPGFSLSTPVRAPEQAVHGEVLSASEQNHAQAELLFGHLEAEDGNGRPCLMAAAWPMPESQRVLPMEGRAAMMTRSEGCSPAVM